MRKFNKLYEKIMGLIESETDIKALADEAKLDISDFNMKELKMGFEAEKEHDGGEGDDIDVVNSDLDILKIVLAHLREDPKYYTKLDKAGL